MPSGEARSPEWHRQHDRPDEDATKPPPVSRYQRREHQRKARRRGRQQQSIQRENIRPEASFRETRQHMDPREQDDPERTREPLHARRPGVPDRPLPHRHRARVVRRDVHVVDHAPDLPVGGSNQLYSLKRRQSPIQTTEKKIASAMLRRCTGHYFQKSVRGARESRTRSAGDQTKNEPSKRVVGGERRAMLDILQIERSPVADPVAGYRGSIRAVAGEERAARSTDVELRHRRPAGAPRDGGDCVISLANTREEDLPA